MADLANMKVKDLIAHAKAKNIKGYSGLRKEQLINLIQGKTVTRKPRAKAAGTATRGRPRTASPRTAAGTKTPRQFQTGLQEQTAAALRDQLRARGLKVSGTKAELSRRLGYALAGKTEPKTRSPRTTGGATRGGATRGRPKTVIVPVTGTPKATGARRGRPTVGPTVKDLKAQAKAKNIKGYYKMNKADLLAALGQGAQGADAYYRRYGNSDVARNSPRTSGAEWANQYSSGFGQDGRKSPSPRRSPRTSPRKSPRKAARSPRTRRA